MDNLRSDSTPVGLSGRLSFAAGYFVVVGALELIIVGVVLLRHLSGAGYPSRLGAMPTASLLASTAAGLLWLAAGFALFARKRVGVVLAIATFVVQAAGWFNGTPPRWGEVVLIVGGILLLASTWREMRD